MNNTNHRDQDEGKGVVEGSAGQTPVSLAGQNGHRDQDPLLKSNDSDFPEPGQNEEHTGEPQAQNQLQQDTKGCSEEADDDPGFRQKENQNKSKDDPLAA